MAKLLKSENVFICRPTALSTVRPNSVFSLSQCLHAMKCKRFWVPHLPAVLIHINLNLLQQNLLLNPVPYALHAWLIAMVKFPTQPKSLSFWPFHSQEPSSAEESSDLEHCQDGHEVNVDSLSKMGEQPLVATDAGTIQHFHSTAPWVSQKVRTKKKGFDSCIFPCGLIDVRVTSTLSETTLSMHILFADQSNTGKLRV